MKHAFKNGVLGISLFLSIYTSAFAQQNERPPVTETSTTTNTSVKARVIPSATINVRPTSEELLERRRAIEEERQARLEEVKTNRDTVETERTKKASEIQTRVTEQRELHTMQRTERAQEFVRRVIARIHTIAGKMETFIPRIEERLLSLEARGMNIETAFMNLTDAQIAIDDARAHIAALSNFTSELGTEANRIEATASVRKTIAETNAYLKEAREHLLIAIRMINTIPTDHDTATTTSATNQ